MRQLKLKIKNKTSQPSRFLVDLSLYSKQKSQETQNTKKQEKVICNKKKYQDYILTIINTIRQLAFFSLFLWILKILINLLKFWHNFFYTIGWFVVFVVRFIFFTILFILKPLFRKSNYLKIKKSKNKINLNKKLLYLLVDKLNKEGKYLFYFNPRFKGIVCFILVAFFIIIPFKIVAYYQSLNLDHIKGRVLGASEIGINNIVKASQEVASMDFNEATKSFIEAQQSFIEAQSELKNINDFLFVAVDLLPSRNAKMASNAKLVLRAGEIGSRLGFFLNQSLNVLSSEKKLDKKIEIFCLNIEQASNLAKELNEVILKIDYIALPQPYIDKFSLLKDQVHNLNQILDELNLLLGRIKIFLGFERDQRYLLVFQNNAELRASGGFMGSYALIDFRKGKIINIEVPTGGSYDTEAGMQEAIISPKPLHLINPRWYFWDSNWWPDWPQSARQIMKFYEISGGSTVDGVISITPTVFERILRVIGPIDMQKEYGIIFDSDNFWLETQKIVEYKQYNCIASTTASSSLPICSSIKPKKVINDLINKILEDFPEKLHDKKVIAQLIKIFDQSIREKHLLFYFKDQKLEEELKKYNWDASIKDFPYDYLMVVNTNIGGGKSDRKIQQDLEHIIKIQPDGSIIETLKIKITHKAQKGEELVGVRNVDWMRIYVPMGSKLISAEGFDSPPTKLFEKPEDYWREDEFIAEHENKAKRDISSGTLIYNEFHKTVFANWVQVDPGKTVTIKIKYKLPFKIKVNQEITSNFWQRIINKIIYHFDSKSSNLSFYALLIQKQPGTKNNNINTILYLPHNFKVAWSYPYIQKFNDKEYIIKDILDADKYHLITFNIF